MAQAKKAEEPSMEEILASIRRIISDEDSQGGHADEPEAGGETETPVREEATDDMGNASEMSQEDLDKLFDIDSDAEDDKTKSADAAETDDMAAAMAADAAEDEVEDDVLELTEEFAVAETEAMEIVEGLSEDFEHPEGDVSFAEPLSSVSDEILEEDDETAFGISSMPVPDDLPEIADDAPLTSENTGEAVHAAFDNLSHMFVGSQAQTVEELVKEMLRPMLKAWLDQNLPGMVEQMVQKEIQRVTRRR